MGHAMKTIKPIKKFVSVGHQTKSMPYGHRVIFTTYSYEPEQVTAISAKWLPKHGFVDRYENSNKGLYNSNIWFQIPVTGKFFIYEHNKSPMLYTVFSADKQYAEETPLWQGEWTDDDNIIISSINE